MAYKITEFFGQIQDSRRKQGQRYSLSCLLTITLMAILSKHQSLKGFARFAKSNKEELTSALNLKYGVPSFTTFRELFQNIDIQLLTTGFIAWIASNEALVGDDFIALDGKAVRSSVKGGNTSHQNFVAVVSAFGHKSGLVYGMEGYENGKSAEPQSLRDLMEKLGVVDKVITMDALHTQKKR